MAPLRAVLDTNVFVAAGFKRQSSSAQLIDHVLAGHLVMVWNNAVRTEIEHTVKRIPPLASWDLSGLFAPDARLRDDLAEDRFGYVEDPADRKFAALAEEADAPLITTDDHLLRWRDHLPTPVLRPAEWMRQFDAG
jgi:predicted nucleic acid-binding protein